MAISTRHDDLLIEIDPEIQLLSGGLQPFLFRSDQGTLIVQAQWPYPFEYSTPEQNRFPGLVANVVSRDAGTSWKLWQPQPKQAHGPIFEGAVVQLNPQIIRIFEWIADIPDQSGILRGHFWDSTDEFETVQGPTPMEIYLPQARGGYDDTGRPYSGTTFHRSVIKLPNGDLLATIYCWFKEDTTPSSYEAKMNRFRSVLLRSTDSGHHWSYVSTIAGNTLVGEEGFTEPTMVRLSHGPNAGRLICVLRVGNRTSPLYQTYSDDDGVTWIEPYPLPLRGVDPDIIEMSDGTLACSYGYRSLGEPVPPEHGNYVTFSVDHGNTWIKPTHFPIQTGSGTDRSTCYTGLREVEPGKLLVVFDTGWWNTPIRFVSRRFIHVKVGQA